MHYYTLSGLLGLTRKFQRCNLVAEVDGLPDTYREASQAILKFI